MAEREDEDRLESLQAAAEQDALDSSDEAMLETGSPARARAVFARALRSNGYDATGARLLPARRRSTAARGDGHRASYDRPERESSPLRASFGPPKEPADEDKTDPDLRPRRR